MMIKMASCQLALCIESPEENFLSICEGVCKSLEAGAQIVVIPELSNSGRMFRNLKELVDRSWTLPDARFDKLITIISGHYAILGGGFALATEMAGSAEL